jgi:hypothetical protein
MEQYMALREWAIAIQALEAGRQVIVLRKGGIAEETKEFRLESPEFLLFPSYEHQRPHLVKSEARDTVTEMLADVAALTERVRLTSYCEVVQDIEVTDSETLQRLDHLHIWTEDYAEERLKWKKAKPLHVLILRVYKLDTPIDLPMRESYRGCKSWLSLEDIAMMNKSPVLDDAQFAKQVEEIRNRVTG